MQRFFQVTSPSVHQMVLSLEKAGLITRQPGIARSITLTIDPADLPELASRYDQPVKYRCAELLGRLPGCRFGRRLQTVAPSSSNWRAGLRVDSDAKCNPVDSIGSSTKSRVSHSERPPSARFPGDEDGSARRNIEPLQ